jgi:hypothetical protein
MAGVNTTIFKKLGGNDIFTDTHKVTTGLFAADEGAFNGTQMETSSVSASNKRYFYTIADGDTTASNKYFDVAFGHRYASGSDQSTGSNASYNETEATYKQFANIVLDDPYTGFEFTPISGSTTKVTEDTIYAISVKTDKMKDRVNGRFTLVLSGTRVEGEASTSYQLQLTNYTESRYSSIAGDYYKIVTGSAGSQAEDSDLDGIDSSSGGILHTYGHFYPSIGTIILSETVLSMSMNGDDTGSGGSTSGSKFDDENWGFSANTSSADNEFDNKLKMVKALLSGSVTMRSEQDLNQTTYYCRMYHNEYNFTSNPSFIQSGSQLGDIIPDMVGDPTTFVTGIGLYNSNQEMVAVAKLNQPQKKDYNTEITVAAKLDG